MMSGRPRPPTPSRLLSLSNYVDAAEVDALLSDQVDVVESVLRFLITLSFSIPLGLPSSC
jgi:hypothetical protein